MFFSPWYLLLLFLIPLIAWRLFFRKRDQGITFSAVSLLSGMAPTLRQRLSWLPHVLTILSVIFVILSLARPREGREQTVVDSEGIAIEMVVDRSGSMQALDFKLDGNPVDRLTAVKNVVGKFVSGGDGLDGRANDLVGLVTFARYADGLTPPTLDHSFLVSRLNQTEIVRFRSEDGTAIGDGISLAVEKLTALDEKQNEKIKSKIIILLTDGENNVGSLDPIQAAELAKTLQIKVYTIGVGTNGKAPMPMTDAFGRRRLQSMEVRIDEKTLTEVAEITGGKYFRATDTDSLRNIYEEIDRLEKSKVESQRYVDYRELAVQPIRTKYITIPPLLLVAFSLLLFRWWLQETWFRELAS